MIRFVLALTLFNMTGVRAARVLLTLYAIHVGAGPFAIGLLAAMFGLFPALLSWLSGRLTDRFGSRWLLTFGAAGAAGGMLLPYFAPGLPTIFAAAAMSGLALTFCNVSLQNLVGVLSEPHERPRNFSNYSLAGATAAFLGPLLAGFAIDHTGYADTCLWLVVLSLVPVAMLLTRGGTLPGGSAAPAAERAQGALVERGMWPILAASSLSQTGSDLFQFYMPVYAHGMGLSASLIGTVLAMYAVASFVVRMFLPRLIARLGEEGVLTYAFCVCAAAFVLVPLTGSATMLALLSFAFGLGMGSCTPVTMMLMFSRSAGGRSGEAMGLRLTADNVTRLIGPAVFGSIASALGLPAVFWINALMLGSGAVLGRLRGARSGTSA